MHSEANAPPGLSWRQGLGHSGAGRAHKVTTLTIQSEAEDLQGQEFVLISGNFQPRKPSGQAGRVQGHDQ